MGVYQIFNGNVSQGKNSLAYLSVVAFLFVSGVALYLFRNNTTFSPSVAETPVSNDYTIPAKSLIDGFPTFPVLPSSNLEFSSVMEEVENGYTAMWYSQQSPLDIINFYQGQLSEQGWLILEQPQNFSQNWEAEYVVKAQRNNQIADLTVLSLDDDDDTQIFLDIYQN